MKKYFYITIHFSPKHEGTLFIKQDDGLYFNLETGEKYRKKELYDFGFGQETGFELMPPLPFDILIKLVEQEYVPTKRRFWEKPTEEELRRCDVWRSNLYGAVSVIMEDHTEELLDFLSAKIETDYFSNPNIRKNFKLFAFDSQKTYEEGKIPGGIGTESYEDIFNKFPKWKKISSKVISQVYR